MDFDELYDQLLSEVDGNREGMVEFSRYVLRSSIDFILKNTDDRFLHIKNVVDIATLSGSALAGGRDGFLSAAKFLDIIYEDVLDEFDLLYLDVMQAGNLAADFLAINKKIYFESMLEAVLRVAERAEKLQQDEQISILHQLSKGEEVERHRSIFFTKRG